MTCDDYQIAFDQQHDVGAHVATCAECAAYVSLSGKLSRSMLTAFSAAPPLPTTDHILARIRDANRRLRRSMVLAMLAPAIAVLAWRLAIDSVTPRTVLAALAGAIAGYAVAWVVLAVMMRKHLANLTDVTDPIARWRRELDRRIRNERQAWWLLPVLLAVGHLSIIGWRAPSLGWLVVEILYLAIPLPLSAWRYRRAVRERAKLG